MSYLYYRASDRQEMWDRGEREQQRWKPLLCFTVAVPESWDLKLKRAWQNYRELDERMISVTKGYEQRAIRVAGRERAGQWHYTAHCDLTIDEMIPVVVGECLFNIRSALDHIAVANVPASRKRQAQFPIITENIEGPATLRTHKPLEDWNKWTTGMAPGPLAALHS